MLTAKDLIIRQPRPGIALCALSKRYRVTLEEYQAQHGGDRHTQTLIAHCSALINEGERHD